jgi:protein-tyrosine-phosphatase/DNA-binding MarR family transcriptional regulator
MSTDESRRARARVHAALGDPARLAIVDTLAWGDASPRDVALSLGMASNLIAHHLQVLQDAGVIVRNRSEGDRRRTYLRLVPQALADLAPAGPAPAMRVVFVCTHNSARSQFAAALWANHSTVPAASAGTRPAGRVHPRAVTVGRRHGLSLRGARPRPVADVLRTDDLVIAVCDQAYEELAGGPFHGLHWSVPDPARVDTDAAFEEALTTIAGRIERIGPALNQREQQP